MMSLGPRGKRLDDRWQLEHRQPAPCGALGIVNQGEGRGQWVHLYTFHLQHSLAYLWAGLRAFSARLATYTVALTSYNSSRTMANIINVDGWIFKMDLSPWNCYVYIFFRSTSV
jgi:hypothetical protein